GLSMARFSCLALVMMMLLPGLAGVSAQPEGAPEVLPSIHYLYGDLIIGTGYEYRSYEMTGADEFYMAGNITVRAGGQLLITNTTLSFLQNFNDDPAKGRVVDRVFTLTVEDGGTLYLNNATLTTHLDVFLAFPSLGVVVRNGGRLYANTSTLAFPGHMLVDNATLGMRNSLITAGMGDVAARCDPELFPAAYFTSPPVLYQVSSQVELTNCVMEQMGAAGPAPLGAYVYSYPFLRDTLQRENVTYLLQRDLNSVMLVNAPGQSSSALMRNDTQYYVVAAGRSFSTLLFDIGPLSFDADEVEAIVLHVLYNTTSTFNAGLSPDHLQITPWLASASQDTGIAITRTSPDYDPSAIQQYQRSYALPSQSSTELRQLSVSYANTKNEAVSFNRIWLEVQLKAGTYGRLNATGGNQLTAIACDLPLNMNAGVYGKLVMKQASNAYLYNVSIAGAATPGSVSPYWPGNSPNNVYDPNVILPTRKGMDDTGQPLRNIIYADGTGYCVNSGDTMELTGFDLPWLASGRVASARLNITYYTDPGYSASNYLQWRDGGAVHNTNIMPVASSTARTITFDLYTAGVQSMAQLRALSISFLNAGGQAVYFDRLVLEVQYDPTFYIYRMADITVYDSNADPVLGAVISSYESQGSPQIVYQTPAGLSAVPPAAVLAWLGRTATDFTTTDYNGRVNIPLLSDVVNGPNTPNARSQGVY
ncbi:MAG: hypothetical protein WCK39_10490, partial [Methanomassiliicoccales archaeon]